MGISPVDRSYSVAQCVGDTQIILENPTEGKWDSVSAEAQAYMYDY